MHNDRISSFLDHLIDDDNKPPFSEAKVEQITGDGRFVTIEEDDEIVGIGIAASHVQQDGGLHWAVETALLRGMRFPEFEARLLDEALGLVPDGAPFSVWAQRDSLGTVLGGRGLALARSLAHLVVDLPVGSASSEKEYRSFAPEDAADVVELNRRAFAGHREASSMDESELGRLLEVPGLGADGLLLVEDAGEPVGFCWTRVHSNGDGEIFRIAIDPERQGEGLGREILLAGFGYLSAIEDVKRGTLWVDLAEERAFALYQSIGMTVEWINREYEPSIDP